ncbi:hypothetical protein NAEGRDRAFT_58435 [Naegleria gruberi]|uniref:F-box domain-containing protein n=1 Tax=Naegleria gruberi TaxID=5762 RepID=D2VJY3_NAEGR|nr:uncharacterized protein NAEGRDRAFT_58435 [Naegleria gruberi]EFC42849.1 hypothetical protein NAEGRDRAFT_58435 [Naegleria gruberi]|eukprot:XP_002675593.1 hypothetical protein NAEGRDRAFT_58435 [Naegleria gruberi strain NEG-M]
MKRNRQQSGDDDYENSLFEMINMMTNNGKSRINNDFLLFSEGFKQENNQTFEELKSKILKTGATIMEHPEAFLKVLIHTKLVRSISSNTEKTLNSLLKLGEVKSEEEWKEILTPHELKLLKSHSPKPPLFEMLNPTVILVCTEAEARIGIPLFRIILKLSEGSMNGIVIRPSDLDSYFENSEELLYNLNKQLINPVMNFRDYILLSDNQQEKEEMTRYLLENGASKVIQNLMNPHEVIEDFGQCAVVVSDSILSAEQGKIYFEMKLVGKTEFYLYSELVASVNEFKHLKPLDINRLKHHCISSELLIEARTKSRHMLNMDYENTLLNMSINSEQQLSNMFPNEVFFNALKFLPVQDILNNFSLVNKLARNMCFQDHLWKDICIAYASNYEFLSPFRNEQVLAKTNMPHYIIFRNIINPIIIDYKVVLEHIYSKTKEGESKASFDLIKFNSVLTTALFFEQTTCQDDTVAIGSTKLFGNFDFPSSLHQHPICQRSLILQLNINDLKEKGVGILSIENSPVKHLLPESGILYFFDNGIILHYDGSLSELTRVNNPKKTVCAKVQFYEALFIPKLSEILFSDPFLLRHLLLPSCEGFEYETLRLDEVFSQLIHPKFSNEGARLFGAYSCFSEAQWYRAADEDEDRFIDMDSYVEVGSIISPLYQFPSKNGLYGFGLIVQDGNQTVWKNVENMPNIRTLQPSYFGNFGREIPSKFKKDFKYLTEQFKTAN